MEKEKVIKRNKDSLRDLCTMTHIHITGVPEEEETEKKQRMYERHNS